MKMTSAIGRPSLLKGGQVRLSSRKAFTLLELVVVLTLIGIITAIAIPSITGIKARRGARIPMQTLEEIAHEARSRAMQEGRPYQVLLTNEKIIAARFSSPYESVRQLEESLAIIEKNTPANGEAAEEANVASQAWHQIYELPEGLTITSRFWDEEQAHEVSVDQPCRWVFQPSGISRPVTVSLRMDPVVFTATFDALTAEITKEASDGL